MDIGRLRSLSGRLTDIRTNLIKNHPFFGRILMCLPFSFTDCGTACTDMKNIYFAPEFISGLDDEALEFLVLHELMHCVLKHCTRGQGKLNSVYNIACDIVVNSLILEAIGKNEIKVGESYAMHTAPDGREGREYTAEEVYNQLLKKNNNRDTKIDAEGGIDNHEVWKRISADKMLEKVWNKNISDVSKKAGTGTGIPEGLKRIIEEIYHTPQINWKQVLHDFIQYDRSDFLFSRPDRRFSGDFLMPSFVENVYGEKAEEIWFVVDTSGSVSQKALAEAYYEIRDSMEQIGNLSGYISFFDSAISKPEAFESVEELKKIVPVGGGGTSFDIIFDSIEGFFSEPPRAIIIITDGFAKFPEEDAAKDIPVIWIIVDSDVETPWGECIRIYTK